MVTEKSKKRLCYIKELKNKCLHKGKNGKTTCSLLKSPYSGRVKVCSVSGDRKTCAQMAHLGLLPGQEIELVCKSNQSQCLIKVNGGTISLDQLTAGNIMVAPI